MKKRSATLTAIVEMLEETLAEIESLKQAVAAIHPTECRLSEQGKRKIHETHEIAMNLRK